MLEVYQKGHRSHLGRDCENLNIRENDERKYLEKRMIL